MSTASPVPNVTPPPGGLPAVGSTRLILDPRDPQKFTSQRETDARTAITRALREYLAQLSIIGDQGNEVRFANVFDTWPDWEQVAKYPSAWIGSSEEAAFDPSSLKPSEPNATGQTPDGLFVIKTSELALTELMIEAWCTENAQRKYISAMLEDALSPVEWKYGFTLECPHYFNARATYAPTTTTYVDDPETAKKRYRIVRIKLQANIDVLRLKSLPLAKPKARVVVTVG